MNIIISAGCSSITLIYNFSKHKSIVEFFLHIAGFFSDQIT